MNALASPALTPATCLEHVKARTIDPPERRSAKHRRAEDMMIDDCKFD
jgi:hypothetical protein